MANKRVAALVAAMGILFVGQAALQYNTFPTWQKDYSPSSVGDIPSGLSQDQLLFALTGFRELVGGILWVRANSFFESGNYDAVVPIIRLVTWLDPRQIDVYSTGMWHVAYNFTDQEHRADRRYVPSALALGREGTMNNPNTYELFFETGWLWYHRIEDDFEKAIEWFEEANKREDILPARANILAQAYLRAGQPDKAVAHFERQLEKLEGEVKKDPTFGNRNLRDTVENNLDTNLVRMASRGWFASQRGESLQGYDTYPPFDVGFSARVTVVAPMVIRLQGTYGVQPLGTRIRFVLKDADMPNSVPGGMKWDSLDSFRLDPPTGITYVQDQLFIRNRRFDKTLDLSRDPTMYSFTADKYDVEFFYSPNVAPAHIQDKFGFNGEGFTDSNFLNTEVRPGQRVIYTKMTLTRDQIRRTGEWRDRVPVVQTPNFVAPATGRPEDDVIRVPNLRANNR